MTEPTLYRSKDVVAAMAWGSAGGKKEWKESGFRPPPIYDSPLTVQQRIIHLVQRGVVNATKVEGSGVSSVRWYDFEAVVEIALALDMQRFGYPWMHMKRVLDRYRERRLASADSINFLAITSAPYGEHILFLDDLKEIPKMARAEGARFTSKSFKAWSAAWAAPSIQQDVDKMLQDLFKPPPKAKASSIMGDAVLDHTGPIVGLSTAILILNVAAWRTHLQAQLGKG